MCMQGIHEQTANGHETQRNQTGHPLERVLAQIHISVEVIHHQGCDCDTDIKHGNFFEMPVFQVAEQIKRTDSDDEERTKGEVVLKGLRVQLAELEVADGEV